MKKSTIVTIVLNILLLIYVFINLYTYFDNNRVFLFVNFYISIMILIILLLQKRHKSLLVTKMYSFVIIFISILVFGFLLKLIAYGESTNITQVLWTFSIIGPSMLILEYRFKLKIVLILIYIIAVLFFTYIFFIVNLHPVDILPYQSHNHISIIFINLTILNIIVTRDYRKYYWLIFPLINFGIAILSIGRGGIIASTLLLIISVIYFLINQKVNIKSVAYILIIAVLSFYFLSYYFQFTAFHVRDAIFEDVRIDIIKNYFNQINNIKEIIIGPNPSSVYLYTFRGLTLHNSLLNMHYTFGVGSIIVVGIIITLLFLKKTHYFSLALLFVILLRGLSDTTFLPHRFDYVFVVLLYQSIFIKNQNQE